MNKFSRQILILAAIPMLWLVSLEPGDIPTPSIVSSAHAVVGRPLSPVSVGGVARRTTRRTVAYSGAAAASQPAPAPAPAPAAAPTPAAAAPALAAGTVVSALPAGCTSVVIDGGNYFECAGVIYQPTFQSNNLVYVVK